MNIHLLKIEPKYFEEIDYSHKTCEIRKNDRDFQVGDYLILAEWKDGEYTGRLCLIAITYIDNYPDGLKDGYVVLSLDRNVEQRVILL